MKQLPNCIHHWLRVMSLSPPILIALVGCQPAAPTPTPTSLSTSIPTSEVSNTPPPSPAGSQEPLLDDTPEAMLINSLRCPDDERNTLIVTFPWDETDYYFQCSRYVSPTDTAISWLTIERYPSRADAEAAFSMATGTLGDDQGFAVLSQTCAYDSSGTWIYLGEQHVVILEKHSPYPCGSIGSTVVDIGFRLELFARTLNFVHSPIGTLAPSASPSLCSGPQGHDVVRAVAISPDGKMLVSGDLRGIKLWSLPEGTLLKAFEGYQDVSAVAISPDSKMLASGNDGTIKLWSLPEGILLKTLKGDEYLTDAVAFSPDGKMLVSGNARTMKLWSLPEGTLLKILEGHEYSVDAVAISPDGKMLVSGDARTIKLWSLPEGILLKTLEGESPVAINPDGKTLASGGDARTIKLWSLPGGTLLKTVEGHEEYIADMEFSPDGKILASGGSVGAIKLWSLPDGALLKTLEGHEEHITDMAISPDGKMLATGIAHDMNWWSIIKLWSLPDGEQFEACLSDSR